MVFRKSDGTGIIFFTNKEVSNIREMVAFSLIEKLLFLSRLLKNCCSGKLTDSTPLT